MYLIFDSETTGQALDFHAPITNSENWPRLVEIAWGIYDAQGKLLHEQQCIIRPANFNIPAEAVRIHGITTAQALAEGIPLADALQMFSEAVSQCRFLVAHNVEFDHKVLAAEFHRAKMPERPQVHPYGRRADGLPP